MATKNTPAARKTTARKAAAPKAPVAQAPAPAAAPAGPKPKKSVALSGIVAGNTALCTVGRSGNDLHYRGYDILDIADTCEFEEVAHLLIHGKLPTPAELNAACAACPPRSRWPWRPCPPPAIPWT